MNINNNINNEKLLKYLLSFYDKTPLIKTIKKNINVNINISFLDLTKAKEKHLFLYFELMKRDHRIFKNNISIFKDKPPDNLGIIFISNGESISTITEAKLINNNDEFKFFCRDLFNQFYNISNKCLYCLEDDLTDFFNCKRCNALICFNCFKTEYMLNGDTVNFYSKKCSICKEQKGHNRTTADKSYKELIDEAKKIVLSKIKKELNLN
jgi:hypothetical protein